MKKQLKEDRASERKIHSKTAKKEFKPEDGTIVFLSFSMACAAVILLLIVQGTYSLHHVLSFTNSPIEWALYTVVPLIGLLLYGVILTKIISSKHIDDINKGYQHLSIRRMVGFMFWAALFEELLFRGLIQTGLLLFLKHEWLAILVTALLFVVFHVQYFKKPLMLLNITIPALVYGWVYAETGNILVPFIIHFLSNLLITLLFKYDWIKSNKQESGEIVQ